METRPSPAPTPADPPRRLTAGELAALACGHGPAPRAQRRPLGRLYLDIRGRIPRRTFWLHGVLSLLVLDIVSDALLEIAGLDPQVASSCTAVVFAWPLVAIAGKRLHDFKASAWWMLINLVPGVGSLATLLVLGLVPGTPGPNRFGPDPLHQAGPADALNTGH